MDYKRERLNEWRNGSTVKLKGKVSKLMGKYGSNHYMVFYTNKLKVESDIVNERGLLVIKGENIHDKMNLLDEYVLDGVIESSSHGPTIKVNKIKRINLKLTPEETLLSSFYFKGIGEVNARKIYKNNKNIFYLLMKKELGVENFKGVYSDLVSEKIVKNLYEGYSKIDYEIKDILFFLGKGLTLNMTEKILDKFGKNIVEKYKEDPYIITEVSGIGFKRADEIVDKQKIGFYSTQRIKAAIKYTMDEITRGEGHTYLVYEQIEEKLNYYTAYEIGVDEILSRIQNKEKVLKYKGKIYDLTDPNLRSRVFDCKKDGHTEFILDKYSKKHLEEGIKELELSGDIVVENNMIMTKESYKHNNFVYEFIKSYNLRGFNTIDKSIIEKTILEHERQEGYNLEINQKKAIYNSLGVEGISIISGPAGSGKTTIMKCLTKILAEQQKEFILASPTGRAAKVMENSTGHPARTIHRVLGWKPEGFTYNLTCKIPTDYLILDEVSMIDMELAYNLLTAVDFKKTKVIFIGDVNQLASVGPGRLLQDLIKASEVFTKGINLTMLDKVKRQKNTSGITEEAFKVLMGERPTTNKDITVRLVEDTEEMGARVISSYGKYLEKGVGKEDIQIIGNTYKGDYGVNGINSIIQQKYNPNYSDKIKSKFYKGDRVINTKNDYEALVDGDIEKKVLITNGETGVYRGKFSNQHFIDYESESIKYKRSLSDIDLAYAITVHKSQGSQFPHVIVMLSGKMHTLSNRNILYTAMTRASESLIVYVEKSAIDKLLKTKAISNRNSLINERLKSIK